MVSRQIKKNLITNVLSLCANVLIGLLYTPYLVRTLGVIAYGIVPLSLIINQYIDVVTLSLTNAFTRFYSISFNRQKFNRASQYISTSIAVVLVLIVLVVIVGVPLVVHLDLLFNIPSDLLKAAQILFAFTLSGFALSLISSVLNVTLYSGNRLDLMNILKILRSFSKLLFAYIFIAFMNKGVDGVGYANFISELLVLILSIVFYKKITSRLVSIRIVHVKVVLLWSVFAMASWTILHQMGDTGLYRVDNIIVNRFWGLNWSGILGAVSELGGYIMVAVGVVGSLFGPLVLIAYAKGDHEEVKRITLDNSLYVGLLSAIGIGLFIGFSHEILFFWLGDKFTGYSHWLVLKIWFIPFYVSGGVFALVYRTWNKVKFPALVTLVLGGLNCLLLIGIAQITPNPQVGVITIIVTSSVFIFFQSFVLNIYCFKKIYAVSYKQLLAIPLRILASLIISIVISKLFLFFCTMTNLLLFLVILFICGLVSILLIYYFVLSRSMKHDIILTIKKIR